MSEGEENIKIKKVLVEYISTKKDKYDQDISYFKIMDKNADQRFNAITDEGYRVPWFKTDKGVTMLKAKQKYMKLADPKKDESIKVDIHLSHYEIEDMEGYYVKSLSRS